MKYYKTSTGDVFAFESDGSQDAFIPESLISITDAEAAALLEQQEVNTVPHEVTMRQARLALLGAGKLSSVGAAIASMPEPQKTAASIEWEYSNALERSNPFVTQLGAALGLDDAAIDALFVEAAKL